MRTTINIPDALYRALKKFAADQGSTVTSIITNVLRDVVEKKASKSNAFRLKKSSFKGKGIIAGVTEGDWSSLRSSIYEGRGG